MFFSGEDDDVDFTPRSSGGSKLASLFGIDQASNQGGNESLKYQAPKEPRKEGAATETTGPQPAVIHAVAAHAYKLADGKYASQGKLGAAIIGSHSTHEYKLLLYLSKQQQVTHAAISVNFTFTIQPNNYGAFYDHGRQNWSLMFDSEQQLVQFAKQVALAKANTTGSGLSAVISQDLILGEGRGLETGDSVELKYTTWLLTDHSIGQMVDSNAAADKLLRFKVGKSKTVKGLDEGVTGLKKGGSRLVIIPPELGYGVEGKSTKVPPSSTLIYEVEAVRVKLAKEKDSTADDVTSQSTTPVPTPSPAPTPGGPPESDQSNLQTSDTSQSTKPDKAKLISRIAKMGQAMFPVVEPPPSPTTHDTDTDQSQAASPDEAPSGFKPAIATKPAKSPKPHPVSPHREHPVIQPSPSFPPNVHPMVQQTYQPQAFPMQAPAGGQLAVYQTPMQQFQPQVAPYGQPYQVPLAMQTDSSAQVLMSESRQQNTELRLSLSKVADKVDKISEKLEQVYQQNQHQHQSALSVSMSPSMETTVLLNNLTRIIQDNERLKNDVMEKGAKIESQNEKISELLARNQRYLEQSNTMLEQTSDSFQATASHTQARVLSLEQDKVHLTSELSSVTSQLSTLQLDITAAKRRESELRQELEAALGGEEKNKGQVKRIQDKYAEAEREREELGSELLQEKRQRKQVEKELNSLKEEMADLKASNPNAEKSQSDKKQWMEEKKQLEKELDDARKNHEAEISKLREKLKNQDSSSADQLEANLNKEWQDKLDRVVADSEAKYQRTLVEARSYAQLQEDQIRNLEEKNESIKSQAGAMKSQYEDRIGKLESGQGPQSREQLIAEVKRVMSSVYHSLKGQFEEKNKYEGADINKTIMATIKDVTLQMMTDEEEDSSGQDSGDESNHQSEFKTSQDNSKNSSDNQSTNVQSEDDNILVDNLHNVISHTETTGSLSHPSEEYTSDILSTHEKIGNISGDNDSEKGAVKDTTLSEALEQQTKLNDVSSDQEKQPVAESSPEDNSNIHANTDVQSELHKYKCDVGNQEEADNNSNKPATDTLEIQATESGEINCNLMSDNLKSDLQGKETDVTNISGHKEAIELSSEEEFETSKAAVQGEPMIQETITSATANVTGDRGNPYYAAELEQEVIEKPMLAATTAQSMGAIPKSKSTNKPSTKQELTANVIKPAVAAVTGDKGNPHYAKELKQNANKNKEKNAGPEIFTDSIMKSVVAPFTGDKGNPYYAAELDKQNHPDVIEAPMVAASVSQTSGIPPKKAKSDKKVDGKEIQSDVIKAAVAATTGDKGNPYYAKELDKTSKAVIADMIKPAVAATTGDRGNIHYAKELDKHGKTKAEHQAVIEEPMVAASTHHTSAPLPPKASESKTKSPPITQITPDIIKAAVAPSTGDKGNPYYAKELEKHGKTKEIVGVIKKESSPITGDKGNPYYAEELSKKVDLLRKLSGGVKPGVGTDSIEAEPDKETDPLIDPIIAPIEVTSTGGTGKETGSGPGKAVLVEAPPTTGGWGNPYREAEAKEINRKQKESGVSGSAKDDDDPVIDTIISPVPAYMTGGEGKLTENGGGPGEAVLVEAPPTTGGWGNPYRAAEAMEIDRKQKEKCQDEVREELISSAAATSSEDKGTAELQKEKKSKDESNKIAKPDQPAPSKDESKKVETTGATAEKSKDKKPETGKSQDSESTNKQSSPVKTSKSTDESSKSSTESTESSKPLIGEEDLKKATKSAKPKPTAQLDSDDDLKGKPPPLFGDEDDNDDLDWLS